LGSGKTTLLKAALKHGLGGKRVALIVNDFGEIGIDGVVLQGMNVDRMVELPSGCICCTIGSRFALAVQEIVETVQPHMIVIETSGVAEPAPLISELSLAGVKTDSVITVADAENIVRFCKESETALRQVEEADFLVLSKRDLVSPKELVRVEQYLRKLNPRALLLPAEHGEVKEQILFANSTAPYWHRPVSPPAGDGHEPHLRKDGITSFSFRSEGLIDRRRFEKFLERLPASVYRAKGIVKFSGESWSSVFNYTCGRYRLEWLAPAEGDRFDNRGVVIGKELAGVQEKILSDLKSCWEENIR